MNINRKINVLLVIALFFVSTLSQDLSEKDEFESEEVTIETEEALPERVVDIPYDSPVPSDPSKVYFAEHFDDIARFEKLWIKSAAKKEGISEDIAKYDGVWGIEESIRDGLIDDLGLVLKSKAKHAAIASRLIKPFVFNTKPLIVQYEVLLQEGQECGGAYLKLLSESPDAKNLAQFTDKTPYTIMFGPDKCGNDHKLHFIFRHRNPKNGTVEEKHCKKPKERLEEAFSDKLPHLYTLVLNPDNTYEISLDKSIVNAGSLFEDFTPAVNPALEIDDPNDNKPEDWDDREKIPDPEALKPDNWDEDAPAQIVDENAVMPDGWLEDEPTHIPDINAQKPNDWDSEMDGEWEPPLVDNPACANAVGCGKWEAPLINNPEFKGKWKAPLIDNPNYKGKWRPKLIANPDYFEDKHPFKMHTIAAVGFELWSMSQDILFDNIIITDDMDVAVKWAADSFDKKRQKIAKDSVSLWGRMMKQMAYRPKAWGLYFVYCMIPILIYIWYLYSCYKEESVVQKIANLTNEYPALWAVYIIVLAIPVVFILYICCKPSSSASTSRTQEKEELQVAAETKKTDQVTEDDRVVEEPEEEEEEEEEAEEDDDKEKYSGEDGDEDEEDSKQAPVPKKDEAPRKRKPRKE